MSIQMSAYLKTVLTNIIFYQPQRKRCRPAAVVATNRLKAGRNIQADSTLSHTLTKSLCHVLQPHIGFLQKRSVQHQFSECVEKWVTANSGCGPNPGNQLAHIYGFDFNEDSSVCDRWKIKLKVEPVTPNLLELHIPAFVPWDSITAPTQTKQILCSITAASCNIASPAEQASTFYSFIIPYDNALIPARVVPLSIPASDGYLNITTIALQYELKNGKTYKRPAYTPCSVVDARYRSQPPSH